MIFKNNRTILGSGSDFTAAYDIQKQAVFVLGCLDGLIFQTEIASNGARNRTPLIYGDKAWRFGNSLVVRKADDFCVENII